MCRPKTTTQTKVKPPGSAACAVLGAGTRRLSTTLFKGCISMAVRQGLGIISAGGRLVTHVEKELLPVIRRNDHSRPPLKYLCRLLLTTPRAVTANPTLALVWLLLWKVINKFPAFFFFSFNKKKVLWQLPEPGGRAPPGGIPQRHSWSLSSVGSSTSNISP